MKNMKYVLGGLLVLLLGAYMVFFGASKDMLPPLLSGVAFVIIGVMFMTDKR